MPQCPKSFKTGDVLQLKSGYHVGISPGGETIASCMWFADNNVKEHDW